MKFVRAKVIRDSNTIYNTAVPAWELQVLTFIFDEGNVQPTGAFEVVDRPYPDAGVEYDRLTRRYGADKASGVPFVASVYGNSRAGIAALARAIAEAQAEDEAQPAAERPAKAPARRSARAQADALLA